MTAAVPSLVPSARVRDFVAHLRQNGFRVGPAETLDTLGFIASLDTPLTDLVRHGLKVTLSGNEAQWKRFDELFDAFWHGRGARTAMRDSAATPADRTPRRPDLWNRTLPSEDPPVPQAPQGNGDGSIDEPGGDGRLAASGQQSLRKIDLRQLVTPEDMAEAERIAERLARALRLRLSRRRRPQPSTGTLDLRRIIRRSLSTGGEPFELVHRACPRHPVRLVLMLDVSGSMEQYSRYLLAFVRGLLGAWLQADAFLFHTRLVHIGDALGDADSMRAMARLSLMAQGFGGGTQIAGSLKAFNDGHAKRSLGSRSIVILLSDGYDTDPPEDLARELARLKGRARRLVWLNPLLGWRNYAPVARGMAAAMPYIDLFAAANTLDSLAALEPELARL